MLQTSIIFSKDKSLFLGGPGRIEYQMKKISIFLFILILSSAGSTQTITWPTGCYLAAYLGGGPVDASNISVSAFNALTGKSHAAFSRYINCGSKTDLLNQKHWTWADTLKTLNARPIFFLMPFDGLSVYSTGSRDADLLAFAQKCSNFQETVFVIFGHEMNTPWPPWGQQPEAFVSAFQHVDSVFNAVTGNIQMCWIPGQAWGYPWGGPGTGNGYNEYYPGDASVDWVGCTLYDRDYDENNICQSNLAGAALDYQNFYLNYSVGHQKPFLIAETGLFDANWDLTNTGVRLALSSTQQAEEKNQWINQVYNPTTLKKTYPRIKMICYFHVSKVESFSSMNHNFGNILVDWRIPTLTNYDVYNQLITNNYFLSEIVTTMPRDEQGAIPSSVQLIDLVRAYPNPFNSTTRIRFEVNNYARVVIDLFDLGGRKIQTLCDASFTSGMHEVPWNANEGSGIYYYRIRAVNNDVRMIQTGKVILVR
jgi:hypothetical protein